MEMIPNAQVIWSYVISEWVPKCKMRVMGNHNLPYASHDTNATIKNYHAYIKATLRATKSQLFGRWVNWCIHQLLGDVLLHYWKKSLKKIGGLSQTKSRNNLLLMSVFM